MLLGIKEPGKQGVTSTGDALRRAGREYNNGEGMGR